MTTPIVQPKLAAPEAPNIPILVSQKLQNIAQDIKEFKSTHASQGKDIPFNIHYGSWDETPGYVIKCTNIRAKMKTKCEHCETETISPEAILLKVETTGEEIEFYEHELHKIIMHNDFGSRPELNPEKFHKILF